MKDHPVGRFGSREHNLVGKFNEFANDETKELLQASESRSSGGFLAGFRNDAADSLRGPGADTYPVISPFKLKRKIFALFLRIVRFQ